MLSPTLTVSKLAHGWRWNFTSDDEAAGPGTFFLRNTSLALCVLEPVIQDSKETLLCYSTSHESWLSYLLNYSIASQSSDACGIGPDQGLVCSK
jgi:hypothetical protein